MTGINGIDEVRRLNGEVANGTVYVTPEGFYNFEVLEYLLRTQGLMNTDLADRISALREEMGVSFIAVEERLSVARECLDELLGQSTDNGLFSGIFSIFQHRDYGNVVNWYEWADVVGEKKPDQRIELPDDWYIDYNSVFRALRVFKSGAVSVLGPKRAVGHLLPEWSAEPFFELYHYPSKFCVRGIATYQVAQMMSRQKFLVEMPTERETTITSL